MFTLKYYRAVHRGIQLLAESERHGWGMVSECVSGMLRDTEHLAAVGVVPGRGRLCLHDEYRLAEMALAGFRNGPSGTEAATSEIFG